MWCFGLYNGIDFNTAPPQPFSNTNMRCNEGNASISDSDGNLLFYTNGLTIWNSLNDTMPNGTNLGGNHSTSQSSIAIKDEYNEDRYYIFSLDRIGALSSPYYEGLSYSILDMSLNNGYGDILETNYEFADSLCEKLTAIRHANGLDYWIVVRELNSSRFLSFLLDEGGVNPVPVISNVGQEIILNSANDATGSMKANQRGDKIAMAVQGPAFGGYLEFFEFDNSTGMLSNPIQISTFYDPYGIEFAPCSDLFLCGKFALDRSQHYSVRFIDL